MLINQNPEVAIIDIAFDEMNSNIFAPIINNNTLEDLSSLEDQFDKDEHYLDRWADRKVLRRTENKTGLERLALADAPGSAGVRPVIRQG